MDTNNNIKALKSGFWYTGANFILKSIGFITTPIFTRLLSHTDYGLYSNYSSWLNTATVFVTLNLSSSFICARFDLKRDFDAYVSSVLVLASFSTTIWTILINILPQFFSLVTGIDHYYINVMMVYLFFYSAVDMFQMRERYYYKYKTSILTSLLIAVPTALISVFLVINFENKLAGRILGGVLPTIVIGIILYIILIWRGRMAKISYWKYALPICLPYIPHVLSLSLLNSMDKMMITKICGAKENALYSVAYSCGTVITLFITSLNTAFSPWLGEKLNQNHYEEIRKVSKYYIILFVFGTCGIMLLTPELLLIEKKKNYFDAIYVMPPVAFGCVCQFMYTMYVNVEQFKKKTTGMAFASVVAALVNYILNSIYIPQIGYIAAAYTTLVSYVILLFIHMILVRHIGLKKVYSTKNVFAVLSFMAVYTLIIHFLYLNTTLRYIVFVLYVILAGYIVIKHKDKLLKILRKS